MLRGWEQFVHRWNVNIRSCWQCHVSSTYNNASRAAYTHPESIVIRLEHQRRFYHHPRTPQWPSSNLSRLWGLGHMMMPWKFHDDISNGSGVIVLTNRQTDIQTDAAKSNTTLVVIITSHWEEGVVKYDTYWGGLSLCMCPIVTEPMRLKIGLLSK